MCYFVSAMSWTLQEIFHIYKDPCISLSVSIVVIRPCIIACYLANSPSNDLWLRIFFFQLFALFECVRILYWVFWLKSCFLSSRRQQVISRYPCIYFSCDRRERSWNSAMRGRRNTQRGFTKLEGANVLREYQPEVLKTLKKNKTFTCRL